MDVRYRDIAKLLARGTPIEAQEYRAIIEGYISSIKAMTADKQQVLQSSFHFSCKVDMEEQQDLFQDLVVHISSKLAKLSFSGDSNGREAFIYSIARYGWLEWWHRRQCRKYLTNDKSKWQEGRVISLNTVIENGDEEPVELCDLLSDDKRLWAQDEPDYESNLISDIHARDVMDKFPERIKHIVNKKLIGKKLGVNQVKDLYWFRYWRGPELRALLTT